MLEEQDVTEIEEYEVPEAVPVGTVGGLAAGSYSSGQSDDGDYYTTKYQ
ncbi:hypothetical protein AB0O31_13530 [Kitasatospora cineracea]